MSASLAVLGFALLVLGVLANLVVLWTFARWDRARAGDQTGASVASKLLAEQGLTAVRVGPAPEGRLTDAYVPGRQTVELSSDVAGGQSVAAFAVAAHEVGHAAQHAERSLLFRAWRLLAPLRLLADVVPTTLVVWGLVLGVTELVLAGAVVLGAYAVLAVVTLPLEIDASRRALRLLRKHEFISDRRHRRGARRVLIAAAATYVIAALDPISDAVRFGRRALWDSGDFPGP